MDAVTNDVKRSSTLFFERLETIPLDARMRTKNALRAEMTSKIMETAASDGDRFVDHVLKPATQAWLFTSTNSNKFPFGVKLV